MMTNDITDLTSITLFYLSKSFNIQLFFASFYSLANFTIFLFGNFVVAITLNSWRIFLLENFKF